LTKGSWAMAARGLPAVYAVVNVLLMKALSTEQFGTLYLFQTINTIIFTFSDNFAFQAIVKFGVEPEMHLQELLSTTSALFLGFALPVLAIMFAFSGPLSTVLKNPDLPTLLPSLTLLVLVTAPRVVSYKLLQLRFRMREMFFVDLVNYGTSSLVIVVLVSMGKIHSALDVIQVTIVSNALSATLGIIFARSDMRFVPRFSRKTYNRILDFVRFQSGIGVISVLQQQADTLLVSGFTGPAGVAVYGGAKLFYRGFEIIRDTAALFVFPASSKYYSRGEHTTLKRLLEKAVGFLYLLIVPVAIVLCIAAPYLYHLVYQHKYDSSIPVFQILTIASLFLPLQIVLATAMGGIGKVREAFRIVLVAFLINFSLALILLYSIGIAGAAIAFVAGTGAQAILTLRFMKSEVGFETSGLLKGGIRDGINFLRDKLGR
jgi:O-antigen/teichoic acid export membrane protein